MGSSKVALIDIAVAVGQRRTKKTQAMTILQLTDFENRYLVVRRARYEKDIFVSKSTFLVAKHDVNTQ